MQTEPEFFCPASRDEWRLWLMENHIVKNSVWFVYKKKAHNLPTITWSDAVDEALCFGWIDSVKKPHEDGTFKQYFCKRKPNSVWSKINKGKIQRLNDEGLMAAAGLLCIETAKQNGSWIILDEVEELKIPPDMEMEFSKKSGSMEFFASLSKSVKKGILQWLVMAKLPQTRQKRINEIAVLAAQKLKPKQFR